MRTSTLALFLTASALVGCGSVTDKDTRSLLEIIKTQQSTIEMEQQQIDILVKRVDDLTGGIKGLNEATRSNIESIHYLGSIAKNHEQDIRILAERR